MVYLIFLDKNGCFSISEPYFSLGECLHFSKKLEDMSISCWILNKNFQIIHKNQTAKDLDSGWDQIVIKHLEYRIYQISISKNDYTKVHQIMQDLINIW